MAPQRVSVSWHASAPHTPRRSNPFPRPGNRALVPPALSRSPRRCGYPAMRTRCAPAHTANARRADRPTARTGSCHGLALCGILRPQSPADARQHANRPTCQPAKGVPRPPMSGCLGDWLWESGTPKCQRVPSSAKALGAARFRWPLDPALAWSPAQVTPPMSGSARERQVHSSRATHRVTSEAPNLAAS